LSPLAFPGGSSPGGAAFVPIGKLLLSATSSLPKALGPFAPLQTIEPQFPALQRSVGAILDTTFEAVTEFFSP
jgi:hypothetical protein